jgi:hypothetical protein
MQKTGELPVDSDRKLIVLKPIEGVSYYYLRDINLYIDIELFKKRVLKKGIEYSLNMLKNIVINKINSIK